MKNNLLIFLGFAVICLVNISAQKRAQQASVEAPAALPTPPPKVEPAPTRDVKDSSASSAVSKTGGNLAASAFASEELR